VSVRILAKAQVLYCTSHYTGIPGNIYNFINYKHVAQVLYGVSVRRGKFEKTREKNWKKIGKKLDQLLIRSVF
jgi:hypothetical protein